MNTIQKVTTKEQRDIARRTLTLTGVLIEKADINMITGHIDVRISFPCPSGNKYERRLITMIRPSHSSKTVTKTSIVALRDGMFKCHWEIVGNLSDFRNESALDAFIQLLTYVSDNQPAELRGDVAKSLGVMAYPMGMALLEG